MTQDRKFLGMTATQIGILASLAGVACLLFGAMGWFILGGRFNSPFSRAPVNTAVVQSTPTLFLTLTPTPTETPTPIPYELLIPNGWNQFKTGLIEIWLPSSFKREDPKRLLGDTVGLAVPELVMQGTTSKSSLYRLLVSVSYEPLVGDSLDTFLDDKVVKISTSVKVVERRKVNINSVDAIRFMFETRNNNVDVNDLTYVFLDGSTIWYVEYSAQINEFYDMLPVFEQSIKTFRIVR